MKRLLIPLLIIPLLLSGGVAGAVTLSASVDMPQATLEDRITYTLTVDGQTTQPPTLPLLNDFQAQSAGTSSQVRIINGHISRSMRFNYLLTPKKAGKFTIGPATLRYNGKTIKSNAVLISIGKPGAGGVVPGALSAAPDTSSLLFAKSFVSNQAPYENEQIIYTLRIYSRVDIANASLDLPDFDGFWKEDMASRSEFRTTINGVDYEVTQIQKALFPLKPGEITINPALLRCEIFVRDKGRRSSRDPFGRFFNDPFFNGVMRPKKRIAKAVRSDKVTIRVSPLPLDQRPKEFINLVGQFTLEARLEKEKMTVGASNTMTVAIQGDGNIRDFEFQLPADPDRFKIYDDQPEVKVNARGERWMGKKTFKKAIVPLKEGTLKLPDARFAYFDPKAGKYKFLDASFKPVKVLPSKEKERFAVVGDARGAPEKSDVEVIGKDIFPIYTGPDAFQGDRSGRGFKLIVCALIVVPTILFAVSFFVVRRREKRLAGAEYFRSRAALSTAGNRLKTVSQAAGLGSGQSGQELFARLSKIFTDYIGDKLNVSGGSLSSAEAGDILTRRGVRDETKEEAVRLLDRCEAGRFTPQAAPDDNFPSIIEEIKGVMKMLDKEIR